MECREYDDCDYFLSDFDDVEEDETCVECGAYSPNSIWCTDCLNKADDLEEYEERKRKRLFEEQEY